MADHKRVSLILVLPDSMQDEPGVLKTISAGFKANSLIHKCNRVGVPGPCPGMVLVTSIVPGDYVCVKGMKFSNPGCSKLLVSEVSAS